MENIRQEVEVFERCLQTGWIQGAKARTIDGSEVPPTSVRARYFCVAGAVDRASQGGLALARLVTLEIGPSWQPWNDDPRRSVGDIDKLIAAVKKGAALGGETEWENEADGERVLVGAGH